MSQYKKKTDKPENTANMKATRSNPSRKQSTGAVSVQREFEALFAALDDANCGFITTPQLLKGFELLGLEVTDATRAILPDKPPAKGYSVKEFEKYALEVSARQDPSILTVQAFGATVSRSVDLRKLLGFGRQGLSDEETNEVIEMLQQEGLAPEVMPALARMFQLNRRLSMFS